MLIGYLNLSHIKRVWEELSIFRYTTVSPFYLCAFPFNIIHAMSDKLAYILYSPLIVSK